MDHAGSKTDRNGVRLGFSVGGAWGVEGDAVGAGAGASGAGASGAGACVGASKAAVACNLATI